MFHPTILDDHHPQLQGQLGKPKTLERSLTHFIASWSEEQAMFFRKVRKKWMEGWREHGGHGRPIW